jgi:5-methylcytosine-specific restriction endonuclease McrA
MQSKLCRKCDTVKSLEDFYLRRGKKNGRQSSCKNCSKSAYKNYLFKKSRQNKERPVDKMGVKFCQTCRNTLPKAEFHRNSAQHDGLQRSCRICMSGINHARRAGLRQASFDRNSWLQLCSEYRWCCFYCFEQKLLTLEHFIPLCLGGSNDLQNLVPACRSCNSSKQGLDACQWVATKFGNRHPLLHVPHNTTPKEYIQQLLTQPQPGLSWAGEHRSSRLPRARAEARE